MSSAAQSAGITARGPRSILALSPLMAMRRNPLLYMEELHREYGDLVHYRTLGREVFMLFHPDMTQDMLVMRSRNHHQGRVMQRSRKVLGNGLLTSEDAFHLRQAADSSGIPPPARLRLRTRDGRLRRASSTQLAQRRSG